MKENRKKILVLDIDGTLTNSKKEVTEKTKKYLYKMQEKGHILVLASGRPTPEMYEVAKEVKLEEYGGYLLSFNGGKVINMKSGEILFQKTLWNSILPNIYNFAKENHCGIVTYVGNQIISGLEKDEYVELEARINQMEITDTDDFLSYLEYDLNKCLMTAEPEKAEEYTEFLNNKYSEYLSIYRSEPFFIEIMPKNVDKAASLDELVKIENWKREDIICVGDGYNDISMIQYAGIGIAMENARDEVKKVADYITSSNDEDGICQVIEKFIDMESL